jgi:hypothetical protein
MTSTVAATVNALAAVDREPVLRAAFSRAQGGEEW